MRRNLERKLATNGTQLLELRGGQVGLEKHEKDLQIFDIGVLVLP